MTPSLSRICSCQHLSWGSAINQVMSIYRKVGDWVRSRRARRVYYTTSLEHETEIESCGCA